MIPAIWISSPALAADDPISLNFKDAEIDSVVGAYGHLLNRTFIIDPRVRGKITLETPRPVSREQAYELLQAALRMQGFAIVDNGGLAKVVPEADAKLQSGPVTVPGTARASQGDQVVTQIFRLQHESASNLVPVLRPLITPNNTITAYPNNNSLVITDYAANVQRLARIISSLDGPTSSEVEIVPIRNALASDIAVTLTKLIDDGARVGGAGGATPSDPGQRVMVLADPRMNAIMIRAASPARMNLAKSLVGRLDQPSTSPGNIHVVYLRNAEALRLAQVLRGVLAGDGGAGGVGGMQGGYQNTQTGMTQQTPGTAFGQQTQSAGMLGSQQQSSASTTPLQNSSQQSNQPTAIVAGGAVIAADPATNSLIITAPDPLYRNLREVIDRLDARRAQIYIESLIVEISATRAAELGVQWQFLDQTKRVIGGTNFNGSTGGGNIITSATNNLTNVGTGLNLGIIDGAVTIGGTQILNLGLLASALETNAGANILATPNLLTLDNEEARIIIGQNVPFITGQYATTATTTGTVNPFQTIERKDVGTVLRVRPQVSEAGAVKLTIFQEVSSVSDASLSAGLITNRRAIESNVLVDDGQMIVLGGLIEDRVEGGEQKVPGLGNLPLIGQLFRYDNRKHTKTNLMVFLRPRVLRDTESSSIATTDRYDYIRQLQADTRLPTHWALPEYQSPVLPPAGGVPSAPSRGAGAPMMVPVPDGGGRGGYPPSDPGAPAPQPAIPAPTVPPSPPVQPVPQAPGASAPGAAPGGPGVFPVVPPTAATGDGGATADNTIDARTSRSAAQTQQAPAPITRSVPTMIQTAPGEGLVPVDRDPRAQPAGPTVSPN
ncbi:MAG: type II secretion system secretin GspD [Burkholderiaceae bacterium]